MPGPACEHSVARLLTVRQGPPVIDLVTQHDRRVCTAQLTQTRKNCEPGASSLNLSPASTTQSLQASALSPAGSDLPLLPPPRSLCSSHTGLLSAHSASLSCLRYLWWLFLFTRTLFLLTSTGLAKSQGSDLLSSDTAS